MTPEPQPFPGMLDIEAIRSQARGAWVMVAADGRTVVSSGDDVEAVIEEAERKGHADAELLAMDFWNEIFIG